MADGVFNVAKGHVAEYCQRVIDSDPTNAVLTLVLAEGTATDAAIKVYDTLSALLGDANVSECDFTNYTPRKEITAPTVNVDDVNHRNDCDMADQTWSSAGNGNNDNLTRLFICYDSDSTAGTDANIIPCTYHDLSVTTDGSDLTIQFDSQGFYSAGE